MFLPNGDGVFTPVAVVVHLQQTSVRERWDYCIPYRALPVTLTNTAVEEETRLAVDLPHIFTVTHEVAPAGILKVGEGPVLGTDELHLVGQLQDHVGNGWLGDLPEDKEWGEGVEHGVGLVEIETLAHSQACQ